MNAPAPTLTPPASLTRGATDALVVHRTLRRLLDETTALVAGVVTGHVDRAELVARHVVELTELLGEHELAAVRCALRVARRDPGAAADVDRLRALRGEVGVELARLRLALPYWARGASAVTRDTVWEVLLDLGRVLGELLATEEAGILPLAVEGDLPELDARSPWLGHVFETLTAADGDAWRRGRMTRAERLRWAAIDGPRFARARRRLHG